MKIKEVEFALSDYVLYEPKDSGLWNREYYTVFQLYYDLNRFNEDNSQPFAYQLLNSTDPNPEKWHIGLDVADRLLICSGDISSNILTEEEFKEELFGREFTLRILKW